MGGAIGILMPLNKATDGDLLLPVTWLIVLAGVVMSARLFLQAHTLRETLLGAAVGLSTGLAGMMILF